MSPVAEHHIALTLLSGGGVSAEFTCTETDPLAACRVTCEQDCEEWTYERGPNGPFHLMFDDDGHEDGWHPLIPVNYCVVVVLMDNSVWDETYSGDDTPARSGPIDVKWIGEGYTWRYAGEADRG